MEIWIAKRAVVYVERAPLNGGFFYDVLIGPARNVQFLQ